MDEYASESPDTAEDKAPVEVPRLRIVHIMMWMAFSAVFLTMHRVWTEQTGVDEEQRQSLEVLAFCYGLWGGLAVSGTLILLRNCMKHGLGVCHQPGHWLLIAPAVPYLISWTVYIVLSYISPNIDRFASLVHNVVQIWAIAVYLWATKTLTSNSWRAFFITLMLIDLLSMTVGFLFTIDTIAFSTYSFFSLLQSLFSLVLSIWLVVLVVLDRMSHQQRDWLHAVGICVFLCSNALIPLTQYLFSP